jgi:hypothetical protein
MVEINSSTNSENKAINGLISEIKPENKIYLYNLCISQGWKAFNNLFVPVLSSQTNENRFLTIWSDEIAIKLSMENYCQGCGAQTNGKLCLSCEITDERKRLACILTKAGEPFGRSCTKEDYPCGYTDYAEKVCYSEYILYIGRKGQFWKIGMSRHRREGIESGFIMRLIEQGLEEVLVLRQNEFLTLPKAQDLENTLTDELGLIQVLKKESKYGNIYELKNQIDERYKNLNIELFTELLKVGLFSPWLETVEAKNLFLKTPLTVLQGGEIISGKIVASWGAESILTTTKGIIKINRNNLVGKKLLPLEI